MAIVQTSRGPVSMEGAKAVIHSPSPLALGAKAFGYLLLGAALLPCIIFILFLSTIVNQLSGQSSQTINGSWTELVIVFGVALIYAYFPVKAGMALIGWQVDQTEISEKVTKEPLWHLFWITLIGVGISLSIEAMAALYTPYTGTSLAAWLILLLFEGALLIAIRSIGSLDVHIAYAGGTVLKLSNLRYPDVEHLTQAMPLDDAKSTDTVR